MVGEEINNSPQYTPTEQDLEQLEEARKILFDDSYLPPSLEEDRLKTTWDVENFRQTQSQSVAYSALNNFPFAVFQGTAMRTTLESTDDAVQPQEYLQGRSIIELFNDVDSTVQQLKIGPEELETRLRWVNDQSFDRTASEETWISTYRFFYPIFEELVRGKGYSPVVLQS